VLIVEVFPGAWVVERLISHELQKSFD